jgi:hypothetical protein
MTPYDQEDEQCQHHSVGNHSHKKGQQKYEHFLNEMKDVGMYQFFKKAKKTSRFTPNNPVPFLPNEGQSVVWMGSCVERRVCSVE